MEEDFEIEAIRLFCNNPSIFYYELLSPFTKFAFLNAAAEVVRDNFAISARLRTPGDFSVAHRILNILLMDPENQKIMFTREPTVFKSRRMSCYTKRNIATENFKPILSPDDQKKTRIVINREGGSCFFRSISDAYLEIGRFISINDMRSLLRQNASRDAFEELRTLWVMMKPKYKDAIKQRDNYLRVQEKYIKLRRETEENIKLLKAEMKEMDDEKKEEAKIQLKTLTDALGHQTAMVQAAQRKIYISTVNISYVESSMGEFFWVGENNITTFEEYRNFMLKAKYWASNPDIAFLERLLNVKIIIVQTLDGKNYQYSCHILDKDLQEFNPDYYIIVQWKQSHYQLIQYEISPGIWRGIFTFDQLPAGIRDGYIKSCMSSPESSYYKIVPFRERKLAMQRQERRRQRQQQQKKKK